MENAGTAVAAGPPEQLDQSYQLDFDPNAVLDTEGLDFGLDGSYEEVEGSYEEIEHVLAGGVPDDAAALDLDPKHGDAGQEARSPSPAEEQAETTEVAEIAGDDAEAEGEYQDEIGYEDDDFTATVFNGDLDPTEGGGAEAGLPDASFEGHPEPVQPADDTAQEAPSGGRDAFSDQEIGFEEQVESANLPGELGSSVENQAAGEEAGEHVEGNDLTVDDFDDWAGHEQSAMEEEESELGNALEDLSHSLRSSCPRVEVLYNEESYSLIGTPEDDPDSYFLSEAKALDRPLSQFLSALREVISDEISPSDELVVRYDPLDLEFGERSNENFLNRTFREILDCHATLGQVPGVSGNPVIHLSVRQDAEEQFLELLAEAELVKGVPHSSEDSEMSEDQDDVPDNATDNGQEEGEAFRDEDLHDYHGEVEPDVTDNVENAKEAELEPVAPHDDSAAEQDIAQPDSSAPQFSTVTAETAQIEEHPVDVRVGAHDHESPEDGAGEEEAWNQRAAEDDTVLQQHAEALLEVSDEQAKDSTEQQGSDELLEDEFTIEVSDEQTHQPSEQQGSDESFDMANLAAEDDAPTAQQAESSFELFAEQTHEAPEQEGDELLEMTAEEAAGLENGGPEQEADTNDDDLIIAFDDEPAVPTIREEVEEQDEYAITYEASEIGANDAEGMPELDAAEVAHEALSKAPENGGSARTATETSSVHTSTTINGDDEIDYEEDENAADDSLTPADDVAQQSAAASGDNDEIDWENDEDEDEYEQQPADEDVDVEFEESKEAALSPSGNAGKRSRTDETESLADETDHKRRRT